MRELTTLASHAREQAATEPDPKVKALWLQIADEIDAFLAGQLLEADTETTLW